MKKKRRLGTTSIEVDIDLDDIMSELETEDLLNELEERGELPEHTFETLRDEELYEEFILAKEKYTYEELLNRLK